MTDTVTVVTNPSTDIVEVVSVGPQGPQGPQGVKGDVGDVNPEMLTLRDAAAASASAAAGSASSASSSASTATTQASAAAASASTATSQATIATNQATTATTKAGEASTSATNAAASASAAASSATTATTQAATATNAASTASGSATTATNQATIATTKASEADASAIAAGVSASNASTSASTAGSHATNAANSASTASSAAATATTQATNASTSATTATTKANDAANSATIAQNAATTADTKATQASVSAAAALASQNAAAVSASSSANGAATSTAKASEAAASAAAISAVYGDAVSIQTAVQTAQSQASLAQGYALSASSVVQQDLSGITAQALHRSPNAITAMAIYDTSKDSDGGAWTEKCQHTSWWNEPLAGKWLGPQANEFDARNTNSSLGSEILTNSTFDSNITGWAAGLNTTSSWDAGRLKTTNNGTVFGYTFQSFTTVVGKTYRASASIEVGTAGPIYFRGGTTQAGLSLFDKNTSSNGVVTAYFVATSTTTYVHVLNTNISNAYSFADNISVREVTTLNTASNDYFQLTTDGKFYRLWKNLLRYSEQFDNAAWAKTGTVTITANADVAPDGTTTADKFVSVGGSYPQIAQSLTLPAGTYTVSMWVKSDGTTQIAQALLLDAGVTTFTPTATWTRVSLTVTITSAGSKSVVIATNSPTAAASSFLIWGAQLEYGSTATTYEAKAADGTTTEIFRGNKADFPRLAAIVAEAGNVNIYDLTEPGRPMWMRLSSGGAGAGDAFLSGTVTYTKNAVAALNGELIIGQTAPSAFGLVRVIFPLDAAYAYSNAANYGGAFKGDISQRNSSRGYPWPGATVAAVVSTTVNAVAMTVLPDAPIDPATGLRVPTIAVATPGGLSVINDTGIVRNDTTMGCATVVFDTAGTVYYCRDTFNLNYKLAQPSAYRNTTNFGAYFSTGGTPGPANVAANVGPFISSVGRSRLVGRAVTPSAATRLGAGHFRIDQARYERSLTTHITSTYNTGWMTGDIRRTYLSDATVESVSGTELVTNGDNESGLFSFGTVVNQDTVARAASPSGTGFAASFTSTVSTAIAHRSYFAATSLQANKSYRFTGRFYVPTGGISTFKIYDNNDGSWFGVSSTVKDQWVTFDVIRPPRASNWSLGIGNNNLDVVTSGQIAFWIDDLSITEAIPDRSYKAAGAIIAGTITKSQLASGTSLVGYSGFSASNYLREPYSADLDFGTGEWTASAWVNIPATLPVANFPVIGSELFPGGTPTIAPSGTGDVPSWSGTAMVNTGVGTLTNYPVFSWSIPSLVAGRFYRVSVSVTGGTRLVGVGLGVFGVQATAVAGTTIDVVIPAVAGGSSLWVLTDGRATFSMTPTISVKEAAPALVFDRAHSSGQRIRLGVTGTGLLTAEAFDGATTRTVTTTAAYNNATWLKARVSYTTDGSLAILVNGREVAVTRGNPLRPYYGRKNLFNYSHTFSNSIWLAAFGGAKVSTSVSDPDGGTNAVEVSFANQYSYIGYVSAPLVSGQQYTVSFWARRTAGSNTLHVYTDNGVSIGTYTPTSTWTRYSFTFTWSGASVPIFIAQDRNASGFTNVQLYGAQLEHGATATSYTPTTDVPSDGAPLTIGNSYAADAPFPGSIALLKLGATVPTSEQAQFMYEQEKQLFRAGALSVLPDTGAINDMAYDDATDRWVAVSAANESYWTGLVRNSVTPSPAGSYTKVQAGSGLELVARSTTNPGVDVTIPAYGLREELVKRAEAAARLSKELAVYDYVGGFTANTTNGSTAIASVAGLSYPTSYIGARVSGSGIPANTTIVAVSSTTIYLSAAATATATGVNITFLDFRLPPGMEAKAVMSAGALKQEGSTKDYTRLYDGFVETIRFGAAPGVTAWVQITAQRITLQ